MGTRKRSSRSAEPVSPVRQRGRPEERPAEAEEVARLTGELASTVKRLEKTTERLHDTQTKLREQTEHIRELKETTLAPYEDGVIAAYADGAKRLREVNASHYEKEPDVSRALDTLARGFDRLVLESESEAKRLYELSLARARRRG